MTHQRGKELLDDDLGRAVEQAASDGGDLAADLGVVGVGDLGSVLDGHQRNAAGTARITQRADGSWLIDGMMHIDEVEDLLDDKSLFPESERGDYQTIGGFMMMRVGRIPEPADQFEWNGMRFEVMDMDGRRVDKILVSRLNQPAEEKADA